MTGRGFSRNELKEAGVSIKEALKKGIPIDLRRKTMYPENVQTITNRLEEIAKAEKEQLAKGIERRKAKKEAKKAAKPEAKAKEPAKKAEPAKPPGEWVNSCPFCGKQYKALSRHKCKKVPAGDARYNLDLIPDLSADLKKKLNDLGVSGLDGLETENAEELAGILEVDLATVQEWIEFAGNVNAVGKS